MSALVVAICGIVLAIQGLAEDNGTVSELISGDALHSRSVQIGAVATFSNICAVIYLFTKAWVVTWKSNRSDGDISGVEVTVDMTDGRKISVDFTKPESIRTISALIRQQSELRPKTY